MSKRLAVIVDIDGTIAEKGDRHPFDWARVGEDTVIGPIRELVKIFEMFGWAILFVSGRSDECMDETDAWLEDNDLDYEWLFMRDVGDYRPDEVVKREFYERDIEPEYDVKYVLDDRNKVVKMWRDLGLTVLQVAEGDF